MSNPNSAYSKMLAAADAVAKDKGSMTEQYEQSNGF
jgi:hypothetical protein